MVADRTSPADSGRRTQDLGPSSPSELGTPNSSLSPLDRSLLTRFYTLPIASLEELFKTLSKDTIEDAPTSLFDLSEWAGQDHIKPRIETRAAQVRDNEQRDMIALLKEIATTSTNPVEKRRAVTTVLKALGLGALRGSTPLRGVRSSPSSPNGGGVGAADGGGSASTTSTSTPSSTHSTSSSSSSSSSSRPPHQFAPTVIHQSDHERRLFKALFAPGPGKVPKPSDTFVPCDINEPRNAVSIVLYALKEMDEGGQITLFNFAGYTDRSPAMFDVFQPRIEKLFPTRFKSHEELSITQTSDHTFVSEVLITNQDNTLQHLTLRFYRPTTGLLNNCWLLKLPDSS